MLILLEALTHIKETNTTDKSKIDKLYTKFIQSYTKSIYMHENGKLCIFVLFISMF